MCYVYVYNNSVFSFDTFFVFYVGAFLLHFFFFDNAVHGVIDGQVSQLMMVCPVVEYKFKLVFLSVGKTMLFTVRYRWRWENWVNCNSIKLG